MKRWWNILKKFKRRKQRPRHSTIFNFAHSFSVTDFWSDQNWQIPCCLLEMNLWFLSRRNCLHRKKKKGRWGKKTHLAVQSNSIFCSFFFFKFRKEACNEMLSSFFLFHHNYFLYFGGTEDLRIDFWNQISRSKHLL